MSVCGTLLSPGVSVLRGGWGSADLASVTSRKYARHKLAGILMREVRKAPVHQGELDASSISCTTSGLYTRCIF